MYVFSLKLLLKNTILSVVEAHIGWDCLGAALSCVSLGSSSRAQGPWAGNGMCLCSQSWGKKSIFSAHKELREPPLRESWAVAAKYTIKEIAQCESLTKSNILRNAFLLLLLLLWNPWLHLLPLLCKWDVPSSAPKRGNLLRPRCEHIVPLAQNIIKYHDDNSFYGSSCCRKTQMCNRNLTALYNLGYLTEMWESL